MGKMIKIWNSNQEALLVATGILLIVGAVNIFSASFVMAGQTMGDSYYFLKRHMMTMLLGLFLLYLCYRSDYRAWKRIAPLFLIVTVVLLLAVSYSGLDANGARRWLKFGVTFQPSELTKLAAVIASAAYLGPRLDARKMITINSWPVWLSIVAFGLVLKQPDMGTAVVIAGLCVLPYFLAGIPPQERLFLSIGGAAGVVALVFLAGYRASRISAWLNPWAYEQGIGYQSVQALMAMGSGGVLGTGLGMGASKFYYLPEAHTDFAFAVLSQEAGFVGGLAVILLFFFFAWHGLKITLQATDHFGFMLAAGITAMISGQAIGNIAMVSGLIPVTGVPLPFISYGGTSLVVNLVAVGLLMSVGRRSAAHAADSPDESLTPEPPKRLTLVSKLHNQKS